MFKVGDLVSFRAFSDPNIVCRVTDVILGRTPEISLITIVDLETNHKVTETAFRLFKLSASEVARLRKEGVFSGV